jgi:DNA-binding NarL/FixJ family response regulator
MNRTRVLIVDDVEQVRLDLRTLLTLTGEVEVVGEAANGMEAVGLTEALKPDAVLMDLEMPVLDGYEATHEIKMRFPPCRVIALTVHDYEPARTKAQQSGVDAFLVKGAPLESILQTITKRKE